MTGTPSAREAFLRRHGWWLLLATALLVLLPGATAPIGTQDDALYAGATLEMIQRREWVVPFWNGEHRLDKPPLTYWAQGLAYAVFGANEFAVRLHSVAAAAGVALVIFAFGGRIASAEAGFLAAGAWLVCILARIIGRSARPDMPLTLAVALAHLALYNLLHEAAARSFGLWWWVLYLSMGVGFLAKGPIALAVPLLSLALFRWVFWRRPLPWRSLRPGLGLLVSVAVIAAWGVPALVRTHGLFWEVGIGHHVVRRGVQAFFDPPIPGFYLGVSFFALAPWMAAAAHGWFCVRRGWNRDQAWLVSWLAGPYLLFSLYATQLTYYVLPALPAFFLLAFQRPWPEAPAPRGERAWFWATQGVLVASILAPAAWLFLPVRAVASEFAAVRLGAMAFLGALLAVAATGFAWRTRRLAWFVPCLLAAAACDHATGVQLERAVIVTPLRAVFGALPRGADFVSVGYRDPMLVFYSGHTWRFEEDFASVAALLDAPGPRCVLLLRREIKLEWPWLRGLREGVGADGLPLAHDWRARIDALQVRGYRTVRVQGLSLARGSWAELDVLYRADG